MKVLITEDTLDSLLSIKISSDGGKTYTDYEVSSLKNGGLAFDCSPKDLKVICDVNTLKYIQVLADGEKATSNVNLSDYLKYRDIYFDVYKNPYYGVNLSQEEVNNLSKNDRNFYMYRTTYAYYCSSENFTISALNFDTTLVSSKDDSIHYSSSSFFAFYANDGENNNFFLESTVSNHLEILDDFYHIYIEKSSSYLKDEVLRTNARVHFIKHF